MGGGWKLLGYNSDPVPSVRMAMSALLSAYCVVLEKARSRNLLAACAAVRAGSTASKVSHGCSRNYAQRLFVSECAKECIAPWERGGETPPSVDLGIRGPFPRKKM